MSETGSSKLVVYLDIVTVEDMDKIVDAVADLLVAEGHGNADEESSLRSLVVVEPWTWPDDAEGFVTDLTERAALICIPAKGEDT